MGRAVMRNELRAWKLKATLALVLGVFGFVAIFAIVAITTATNEHNLGTMGGSLASLAATGSGMGLYLIWKRRSFGAAGCFRHPDRRMLASCNSCGPFCPQCLQQVDTTYYCKSNEVCSDAFSAVGQRRSQT